MAAVPFVLNFGSTPFYDHHIFPNHMYRRSHERHHDALDFGTLGMMARLWPHHKHLAEKRNGELNHLGIKKKGNFEIHLDVGLFKVDEVSVKLVDHCLVIEGKHEEREDQHGHIARHFVRRYDLPEGLNLDLIGSTLSSDGVLTVKIPALKEGSQSERVVPIQQVGPSDLFLKNETNANAPTDKSDKGNNTEEA